MPPAPGAPEPPAPPAPCAPPGLPTAPGATQARIITKGVLGKGVVGFDSFLCWRTLKNPSASNKSLLRDPFCALRTCAGQLPGRHARRSCSCACACARARARGAGRTGAVRAEDVGVAAGVAGAPAASGGAGAAPAPAAVAPRGAPACSAHEVCVVEASAYRVSKLEKISPVSGAVVLNLSRSTRSGIPDSHFDVMSIIWCLFADIASGLWRPKSGGFFALQADCRGGSWKIQAVGVAFLNSLEIRKRCVYI